MRLSRAAALLAALIAVAASACGDETVTDPAEPAIPSRISASLVPLDVFGLGAGPRGCESAAHRQFDFWLGSWDVFGGGGLAGTNEVRSRIGSCVVEENWTSAFQGRGRSLNAYDAASGTWTQMWVASGGCPSGVLVMAGTFAAGSMTLQGTRTQPEGFLFAPPCAPPPPVVVTTRTDLFRWTPLPSGSVLQQFVSANDGAPLPPLPPPSAGIGLRYDPVAEVTSLSPADPSFCPTRAAAHQFDFMLGTWQVHQGNGNGVQGTATFTADLNTCLIEETFTGPGDYEGLSFSSFDVFTQLWTRTWMDSDGRRLIMTGGLDANGVMVLRGSRSGSGGRSVDVRIIWQPEGPNDVLQRWEFSKDGGETWTAKEIRYSRLS